MILINLLLIVLLVHLYLLISKIIDKINCMEITQIEYFLEVAKENKVLLLEVGLTDKTKLVIRKHKKYNDRYTFKVTGVNDAGTS